MNKIMIIEDTGIMKLRLSMLMNSNNLDVMTFQQSKLSTDAYMKYIIGDVSLFIIDLDSRSNNAIDYIKTIRKLATKEAVPIITMSRNSNIKVIKQALIAGCDDFILKPFRDDVVLFKAKKLLGERHNHISSPNEFEKVPILESDEYEGMLLWNKEFEINVEAIDKEHRDIIKKYEQLYDLMKSGKGHDYYDELVNFLNDYVHTHFKNEEAIHLEYNYPERMEHHQTHEAFKKSVLGICESAKSHQVTNEDLIQISLFLKNWLITHILVDDIKFGNFMANKD